LDKAPKPSGNMGSFMYSLNATHYPSENSGDKNSKRLKLVDIVESLLTMVISCAKHTELTCTLEDKSA
jgi:hypothetical protein